MITKGSSLTATTGTRRDARLWACLIEPLHAAGVVDPHAVSRTLIAIMRREDPTTQGVRSPSPMEQGARSFGPGEDVPYDVITVYDLDGDIWDRWTTTPDDTMRDSWRMRDYDPAEQHDAAAGVYTTPSLLTQYGPITHIDVPWEGGPRGLR